MHSKHLVLKTILRILLISGFFLPGKNVLAQPAQEQKLIRKISEARSDSERILDMGVLVRYYYANREFDKADSLFEKQVMLGESSLQPDLVFEAYFRNTAYLVSSSETKVRSKNSKAFVKRGQAYAKANERTDYVSIAYAHMSAINLSDGQPDEAFRNANLGFTTALNTTNDSARVITALQLGTVYQEKSDVLMAFKVFTNAQIAALHSGNESLLPPVFHALSLLYKKLGKEEEAKKYLFQSQAINKKINNIPARIQDNIALAKLSNYIAGKGYLQEAIQLSDSANNVPLKIEAEKILFSHMLLQEKPAHTLQFLEAHEELKKVFINTGPSYLDWMLAEVYLYGGKPDSAMLYFKKAESAFNTGYDLTARKNFFVEYAFCCQSLNNIPSALLYYQKSYELAKASSDLRAAKSNTHELKKLYEQQGDFKKAYEYSVLYEHYEDSVDLLGRERDLALLEIENETRQQQREAALAKEKLQRKYNLQYMLITIAVATVFVLLIMVGMFRVSAFTIRIMGFLSLIFLFEFIILILDNWIHHFTHGEPWKVLLIKIGIISVLLPVHHYLEHKLIRYLLSRHLITVRSKLSPANLFRRKNKAPDPSEEEARSQEEINPD